MKGVKGEEEAKSKGEGEGEGEASHGLPKSTWSIGSGARCISVVHAISSFAAPPLPISVGTCLCRLACHEGLASDMGGTAASRVKPTTGEG